MAVVMFPKNLEGLQQVPRVKPKCWPNTSWTPVQRPSDI